MKIQAILFRRKVYTIKTSQDWLKLYNIKYMKIHVTKNYIRYRIYDPKKFKYFRIINIKKDGNIKAVYGYI